MSRLDPIVEARRVAVAKAKRDIPIDALRGMLPLAPAWRDFGAALRADGLSVIAEVKRRSPSAGDIKPAADAGAVARTYFAAGARAISVLTETEHFGGTLDDLRIVRDAQHAPVLRKDFVIDPYQIVESRAAGGDAVLLIAAVLGSRTGEFVAIAADTGLDALVEVHDERELEIAIEAGAKIIGVNNRNLKDLSVDLSVFERLAPLAPKDVTLVAESGVENRVDGARMQAAGAHAVLVGSALMRAQDPAALLTDLAA